MTTNPGSLEHFYILPGFFHLCNKRQQSQLSYPVARCNQTWQAYMFTTFLLKAWPHDHVLRATITDQIAK